MHSKGVEPSRPEGHWVLTQRVCHSATSACGPTRLNGSVTRLNQSMEPVTRVELANAPVRREYLSTEVAPASTDEGSRTLNIQLLRLAPLPFGLRRLGRCFAFLQRRPSCTFRVQPPAFRLRVEIGRIGLPRHAMQKRPDTMSAIPWLCTVSSTLGLNLAGIDGRTYLSNLSVRECCPEYIHAH